MHNKSRLLTALIACACALQTPPILAGTRKLQGDVQISGDLAFSSTSHLGLRPATLTTAQRDALTGAVALIYNSTTATYQVWTGAAWENLSSGAAGMLLDDGSVPLTANWDAGSFQILAQTFQSDVLTGTPPFTVASTTNVANLNADTVDGIQGANIVLADGTVPLTAHWDVGTFNVTAQRLVADQTAPGSAATPTLALGNGDTGFYENPDNTLVISLGGIAKTKIDSNGFSSVASLSSYLLKHNAGSNVTPTYSYIGDQDTGIYSPAANQEAVSCGGSTAINYVLANGGIHAEHAITTGITASTTQTQAAATQLVDSYNVVAIVANPNDACKLAPIDAAGDLLTIVNDGANTLQLFPGSGDDLGAGVDTSITIAAGSCSTYVAADMTNWVAVATTGTSSRTGVYRTIWIDAGAMIPRTTAGPATATVETATNQEMADYLDYDAATAEYAQARISMPDTWDLGAVKAKIYWTSIASSGDVVWGIQGVSRSDGDAIDAAFGAAQTVTDTFTLADRVHVTIATAAITVGGTPALGDVTWIQVYRDAADVADTLASDARLIGIAIQYHENATEPSAW